MKVHVVRAAQDATIGDAVDMMDLYQVTLLPVVDDQDHLIGIVSESDIVKRILSGMIENPDYAAEASLERALPLNNFMTREVVAVDERDSVIMAATIMMDRDLKRLPVTSDGRLVGTIARIDVCQALLEGEAIVPDSIDAPKSPESKT